MASMGWTERCSNRHYGTSEAGANDETLGQLLWPVFNTLAKPIASAKMTSSAPS